MFFLLNDYTLRLTTIAKPESRRAQAQQARMKSLVQATGENPYLWYDEVPERFSLTIHLRIPCFGLLLLFITLAAATSVVLYLQ